LIFTGNNIAPKGDLASRSLIARIIVDRPDPENRRFQHLDPINWTLDHRGEILEALYPILVGNPRLYKEDKDEGTRFKLWQRVIGAAIEHAAELAGGDMDFARAFADVGAEDEETSSLAEALQCLDKRAKGAPFKSADVLTWASGEDDDAKTIRTFFCDTAVALTARLITRRLKAAADAPTIVGDDAVWTLRATNSCTPTSPSSGSRKHAQRPTIGEKDENGEFLPLPNFFWVESHSKIPSR
jgi:hypothetical protein